MEVNIKGIKCDNPECDFADTNVKSENYYFWLNKSCPKCGQNLLTEDDFANVLLMTELVNITNKDLPESLQTGPQYNISIKMDGTGKMEFSDPVPDKSFN